MRTTRSHRFWGCVFAGTAVALGAWAAHGLETTLVDLYGDATKEVFGRSISAAEKYMGDFRTGVSYQMWHALALISLARRPGFLAAAGRTCLIIGTLIFSGSLYALVLSGIPKIGAATPIGGVFLLVGWMLLIAGAGLRSQEFNN